MSEATKKENIIQGRFHIDGQTLQSRGNVLSQGKQTEKAESSNHISVLSKLLKWTEVLWQLIISLLHFPGMEFLILASKGPQGIGNA